LPRPGESPALSRGWPVEHSARLEGLEAYQQFLPNRNVSFGMPVSRGSPGLPDFCISLFHGLYLAIGKRTGSCF
jgi:hypothetical protein